MKRCKNDEDVKMIILTELNRVQKIISFVVISGLQDIISKELLGAAYGVNSKKPTASWGSGKHYWTAEHSASSIWPSAISC